MKTLSQSARLFLLLGLGHLIVDMYAGFLAPLAPLIRRDLGLSVAAVAFLATIFSMSTSLNSESNRRSDGICVPEKTTMPFSISTRARRLREKQTLSTVLRS